jgi:rod shape-determining protein MreB
MALGRPLAQIVETVKAALEQAPPELAADISTSGLVLVGGGALLRGIDERLRRETQLAVHVAESPLTCVAVGAGHSLEEAEALQRAANAQRRSTLRSGRRGIFARGRRP